MVVVERHAFEKVVRSAGENGNGTHVRLLEIAGIPSSTSLCACTESTSKRSEITCKHKINLNVNRAFHRNDMFIT